MEHKKRQGLKSLDSFFSVLRHYVGLILLFSIVLINTNAQTYTGDSCQIQVDYQYSYQPYPEDTIKIIQPVTLLVGNYWLEYWNKNTFDILNALDTVDGSTKNLGRLMAVAKKLPKSKTHPSKIFQEIGVDSIKVEYGSRFYYAYQSAKPEFNWQIGNEQKQIANYTCYKATTTFKGRNYQAWFTPEIPVPYGPYKFSGLPGLILEIRDTQGHHVFELISVADCSVNFRYSLNYTFRPHGKWVNKYIKKAKAGLARGVEYHEPNKKGVVIPEQFNTQEYKTKSLLYNGWINPIEITEH
jgi:GLPGLI family protein